MAKTKKFDFQVSQKDDEWVVDITRKVSSKKTIVSKSQGGFSSELEATEWGRKELATFLEKLSERNKRRAEEGRP